MHKKRAETKINKETKKGEQPRTGMRKSKQATRMKQPSKKLNQNNTRDKTQEKITWRTDKERETTTRKAIKSKKTKNNRQNKTQGKPNVT